MLPSERAFATYFLESGRQRAKRRKTQRRKSHYLHYADNRQLVVVFFLPPQRFRSSNGGVCGATLLSDGSVTKFQAELQFARHCTSRRRRTATTR